MSYPISYQIDFVERRSRLATICRIVMVIPLYLVGIVYGVGMSVVVPIAWFALLLTGRWPLRLYDFTTKVIRFNGRMTAFLYLTTDVYPPFGLNDDPAYPVHIGFGLPLEHYSRLKVLLRGLYIIPLYFVIYLVGGALGSVGLLCWLVIVATGRQPAALQDGVVFCLAYYTRTLAFLALVTETFPPFDPNVHGAVTSGDLQAQQALAGGATPDTWRCVPCGLYLVGYDNAIEHVDKVHLELAWDDPTTALERVSGL